MSECSLYNKIGYCSEIINAFFVSTFLEHLSAESIKLSNKLKDLYLTHNALDHIQLSGRYRSIPFIQFPSPRNNRCDGIEKDRSRKKSEMRVGTC